MAYVIELQSVKAGLLTLLNDQQSHIHLDMAPAGPGRPSRIPVTAEQFLLLRYDIEGHAEGKFGVPKDLLLWVKDTETGEAEPVSFEDALAVAQSTLFDDAAALAEQAAAQARQDAALEQKRKEAAAQAQASDGTLTSAVAAGVAAVGGVSPLVES